MLTSEGDKPLSNGDNMDNSDQHPKPIGFSFGMLILVIAITWGCLMISLDIRKLKESVDRAAAALESGGIPTSDTSAPDPRGASPR